jgi:SAM-dependent methyltransferase
MNPLLRPLFAAAALACALPLQAQVIVDEVPFITSPDNVTLEMLRVAEVGPRDHVIDLGSGDGRIVILAAKRFGASGLGVEIVPDLVRKSRQSARDAGVADRVEFREQDLFQTDLSRATVVTMYLLPEVNLNLRPSILALKPGTRIVSHDWDMGDWKPDQTTVVAVPDKKVGLEKSSRIHLWVVPAKVEGLWCAPRGQQPASIELRQKYQEVTARVTRGNVTQEMAGRLRGTAMELAGAAQGALKMELQGEALRVAARPGPAAETPPAFVRAQGGRC